MTKPILATIFATLLVAAAVADEKLKDIACRSVHLGYAAPDGLVFLNEVKVETTAPGTYFCVCGFSKGYYGLQEQGRGKKVVIFSVWDPGAQDDPTKVETDRRVKLISKDPKVRVGRFGNEGTGGQSFLDLDWKPGETYRFAVKAKVVGERTEFSALIQTPGESDWRHLATFSTITGGKPLSGYYSFIEDFKRDRVSPTKERRASFGGGWVQSTKGDWVELTKARFTGDSNPAMNIDAGLKGAGFFLATGGEVKNAGTPLKKWMERRSSAKAPSNAP